MSRGTTEDVRRANLAAVLGILHRGGPASRSALGRLTGRNRSTIASLVADLVDLGLAVEGEPDSQGQVGRPSPVVSLRPEVMAIAVNPEIDALTIGLVGLDGAIRRVVRHEYDRIPTAGAAIAIASRIIGELVSDEDGLLVAGIGVAVPGQVRTGDGVVRGAPHLDWHDEPFGAPLAAATGYPVLVANDAALGALAEHEFGAGRGHDHLVYVNGGASGIGGGVITAGTLLGGASGHAGELGHVRVSSSAVLDSAGISGTLEAEVTRAELMSALRLPRADSGEFEAALLADRSPAVAAIVERQLGHLGAALASAINLFNPEVIALGGFLAALRAYDPDALDRAVTASTLAPSREGVRITPAELGADLLMIGAAGLAFRPLLEDPGVVAGWTTHPARADVEDLLHLECGGVGDPDHRRVSRLVSDGRPPLAGFDH